jgi:hypothetical protein
MSSACDTCKKRVDDTMIQKGFSEGSLNSMRFKIIALVAEKGWGTLESMIYRGGGGRPKIDPNVEPSPKKTVRVEAIAGDPLTKYFSLVTTWRKACTDAIEKKAIDKECEKQKTLVDKKVKQAKERLDSYTDTNASILEPIIAELKQPLIERKEVDEQRVANREDHAVKLENQKEMRKQLVNE